MVLATETCDRVRPWFSPRSEFELGNIVCQDCEDIHAFSRYVSIDGKVDRQYIAADVCGYNMNAYLRRTPLLLYGAQETRVIAAHGLLLSVDHHLRSVDAVETEACAVGVLSFRIRRA